jgi:formamidopyrimidine-DNA glycosylase
MPELPEVETIRRQLCEAGVEGRIIEKAHIEWPRTVESLTPEQFREEVQGHKIEKLSRHGKWLIFQLDKLNPLRPAATPPVEGKQGIMRTIPFNGGVPERRGGSLNLLVHLRMTGGFYLSQGALKKGPHDRAILQLSGGLNLHFRDPRKFGRWRLEPILVGHASRMRERVSDEGHKLSEYRDSTDGRAAPFLRGSDQRERQLRPTIAGLGPDALTVTKKEFFHPPSLKGSGVTGSRKWPNKMLKALLLDQSFVAGVGNIYADEALFEARLDPRRKSSSLSEDEVSKLWKAVRKVIEAGVRNGGTSLGDGQGNYVDLNGEAGGHREKVKVYGRAGEPCVVCKQPLHKTQIAQRTTVFCSRCQK